MPAALTTLLCPQTVYFRPPSSTRVRVVHLILETLRDGRKIPGPGARAADRGSRLAAGGSSPMYSCRRDGSALKTHCLHLPFSQGGLRAGLPTVLGGRWRRVRVCISANRLLASCSSGEAARLRAWHCCDSRLSALRLGRATLRYGYGTDPQLLQGDTFPHYPTCTRTIYSIYSAFYSCGLAVHLSNDPSSP
jgi:hypothetical protein